MYGQVFVIMDPKAVGMDPSKCQMPTSGRKDLPLGEFREQLEQSKVPWLMPVNKFREGDTIMRRHDGTLCARLDLAIDPTCDQLFVESKFEGVPVRDVQLESWVTVYRTDEKALKPGTWKSDDGRVGAVISTSPTKDDSRRMNIRVHAKDLPSARKALIGVLEGRYRSQMPWVT